MPVFQVGVAVSKKVYTDVTVRVVADTQQKAEDMAHAAVQKLAGVALTDIDVGNDGSSEWELQEYAWEGSSEDDLSEMKGPLRYAASIDLTETHVGDGGNVEFSGGRIWKTICGVRTRLCRTVKDGEIATCEKCRTGKQGDSSRSSSAVPELDQ